MTGPARTTRPLAEPRLLAALREASGLRPTARKLLVGPDVNWGRELLVALARRTGGWVGWEATTLREIANELALVPLARMGIRVAGDIELAALIDRAIDSAAGRDALSPGSTSLLTSLGFRTAMRDAVLSMRSAGIVPAVLLEHAANGSPANDLAIVAEAFEHQIAAAKLADPATVFRLALEAFDAEAPYTLPDDVFLAPALFLRGLPGQLAHRLIERGATPLASETPAGLDAPGSLFERRAGSREGERRSPLAWCGGTALPTREALLGADDVHVDLFAAATPGEELREALRRAIAEGWRLDQVEIATTDPDAYGIALDALCQRIGIGCTMLAGLPLVRTRIGRALERWLSWLSDGLPVDTLRHAIEAGELAAPVKAEGQVGAKKLSRQLRRLQIGWGRERYVYAIAALDTQIADPDLRRSAEEQPDEVEDCLANRVRAMCALKTLLETLVASTPVVPERGSNDLVTSSPASLAKAAIAWLDLVPSQDTAEHKTMDRLRTRLSAIAGLEDAETSFATAMAAFRSQLADLRAWPIVADEHKPWSAAAAKPHLTDLAHAGTTGRPRVFVTGLDADRTGAGHSQDPFLNDSLRARLGDNVLPTTAMRQREREWLVTHALGGLRGRVTLSFATHGSLDGRDAAPAPQLLQAFRIANDDAKVGYKDLRAAVTPPASPVPAEDSQCIDGRDAWLGALADGALLLDGTEAVLAMHQGLRQGIAALREAAADSPNGFHGILTGELPRIGADARPVSPTALELFAKCPMAWLYKYGIGLRPPEDAVYDPDAWLTLADRGSLLHEVYERFGRTWVDRQDELGSDEAKESILRIVREEIAAWRDDVPPPSQTVFESESEALREDALSFLQMERDRANEKVPGRWRDFEREFGGTEATTYIAGAHSIRIRGKIDRVDDLEGGTRRVVDYKTGRASTYEHDRRQGPFRGGRTLQAALYSRIVEQIDGVPVSHFEYRFPTQRGENGIVRCGPEELAQGEGIVERLLQMAEQGHFVPTTDAADCRHCDYQPVCRAGVDGYGNPASPRAAWAKERADAANPVYEIMRRHRLPSEDA